MFLVSEWEVKLVLFSMNPEKVHGPDGLTSLFYQKFDGIMANGLSDANICLIPKKKKQMGFLSFDQLVFAMSGTR